MKRKTTGILGVALLSLFILSAFFTATLAQTGEQNSGSIIPPDMSQDALQYNRTDLTPSDYMESIQAREINVFFYRNLTVMMNCTQNCELKINLDPQVRTRLVSISMEPNQTMKLTMNVSAEPPEGEMVMERTLNFYMGLEPNATLQLQNQLRLHINRTELSKELGREVKGSSLTWMYWNQTQSQWTPVESYMDQNGYLVCNTTHFSTWTVAETEADQITENITLYTIVGLVATILIASIYIRRKKK